jgi:hypothetical protein
LAADRLEGLGNIFHIKLLISNASCLAGGDSIPSKLVVWAAGTRGPDVLKNLDGLEVSALDQLVVRPTLKTTRDDNIFAMGNCAYLVPDGEERPIPPSAAAIVVETGNTVESVIRTAPDFDLIGSCASILYFEPTFGKRTPLAPYWVFRVRTRPSRIAPGIKHEGRRL